MTMDDYLNVRMISTPFCLYDCDVPCDGGTAVIVSRVDTVARPAQAADPGRGGRAPRCAAVRAGTSSTTSPRWRAATPARSSGAAPTSSRPTCSSPRCTTASRSSRWRGSRRWASAARASPVRSSRAAQNIARDGVLPLNTHGGQLSAGRLHGYGFLHEACVAALGRGGRAPGAGRPRGRRRLRRRRPARRARCCSPAAADAVSVRPMPAGRSGSSGSSA